MFASTNVLTAGPEPPGPDVAGLFGSVSRLTDTPPMVRLTEALPVTLPADGEVNVTVHRPLTVPVVVHVLALIWKAAPLLLVRVTVGLVPSGTFTKPLPAPVLRL